MECKYDTYTSISFHYFTLLFNFSLMNINQHRNKVLSLYKILLKHHSAQLQLSDSEYFCSRIREAFRENKNVSIKQGERKLEVGRQFNIGFISY